MASVFFSLRFFLFYFWREKKSKSRFWGDGIFFGLGRFFKSTGSWDFSSLSFDRRPLNVGRHVEISFI